MMRREELAFAAEELIRRAAHPPVRDRMLLSNTIEMARARFLGVGSEKYQITPDEQAFERSSIPVMLYGLREELVDVLNYATMLRILTERNVTTDPSILNRIEQFLAAMAVEIVNADAEVQSLIGWLGGATLQPGEDYVDALNREVGEGWEAKRDA